MNYIIAAVLLLLALAGVVVRKTYFYLPLGELKRRAAKGDSEAAIWYQAAAYDSSLRALLWLYIGFLSAASIILLARQLPVWASLLIVGPVLWIAFSLLPATRTTAVGRRLTSWATPILKWLLNYLHAPLSRSAQALQHRYEAQAHTRLFEKADVLQLLERQQLQADNRLTEEELEIIKRALQFNEHKVIDILSSRGSVKIVKTTDTVGPVLINELHSAKQTHALVREDSKGPFVGTLAVNGLGLHELTGQVRDHMQTPVYYLHEDDNLGQALHAFFATNQPVFAVVDNFEEYVGIVTVENILRELIGHLPGDDFEEYANPAAVAARHTAKKATEESETEPEPIT